MKKEKKNLTVHEVVEKTKEILKSKLVDGNNFVWLQITDITETIEDALDRLLVSKRDKDNLQAIYRAGIRNAVHYTDIAENIYYQQEKDNYFICYKETKNGGAAINFHVVKCKDIDTKVITKKKEVYDLLKQVGVNVDLLKEVEEKPKEEIVETPKVVEEVKVSEVKTEEQEVVEEPEVKTEEINTSEDFTVTTKRKSKKEIKEERKRIISIVVFGVIVFLIAIF